MNSPIASWLRRSCRIARTIRGENCPIANCTATSVNESTTLVNVTSAVADDVRIVCTDSAEPVTDVPTKRKPDERSSDTNTNASPTPPTTQHNGTSHNRVRAK